MLTPKVGTMDAILCTKDIAFKIVNQMLLEVDRVLRPGGTFVLVTMGKAGRRLPSMSVHILCLCVYAWVPVCVCECVCVCVCV